MAILASIIGICSVLLGLNGSLEWDTPAGPSIVVAAMGLFIVSIFPVPAAVKSVFQAKELEQNHHHDHKH